MTVDEQLARDLVARLRRIEGQVRGIQRMVEEGRDCRDVVTQFSAAGKALEQAGFKYFANVLADCIANPEAADERGYSAEEMERLFMKLS